MIGEAKRFLAYEIVKKLTQKNEIELLHKLANGVQENERKAGKKHQVFPLSFDAKVVEGETSIQKVLDYMHHNPVSGKWRLVADFMDYEYSSARFYESGKQGKVEIYPYLDAPNSSEFPSDNAEGYNQF